MRPNADDFEEFARARTPHLYRTAWLLAGDRHHAEDLVQETLAKMFRAWRGVQRIDNPSGLRPDGAGSHVHLATAPAQLDRTADRRPAGPGRTTG